MAPRLTDEQWDLIREHFPEENIPDGRPGRKPVLAHQQDKLADLLKLNLRSVRAYLLKEQFQFFWSYKAPGWAARYLDQWCTRAMRSKLAPMKKVAIMLPVHRPLLLNWSGPKGGFPRPLSRVSTARRNWS